MINTVLLEGLLSKERLKKAIEEIREIAHDSQSSQMKKPRVTLVISSTEGDGVAAVSFVEAVKNIANIEAVDLKLYEAVSTAAFITLSLYGEGNVEMSKSAILGIHRGEIRLSPSQIGPDRRIDESLATSFQVYDKALVEALKDSGLSEDATLMSDFYATDWLRLSAEECLKRRIVDSLF